MRTRKLAAILLRSAALWLVAALIVQPVAAAAGQSAYRTLGNWQAGGPQSFSFIVGTDSHVGYAPATRKTKAALDDMLERCKDAAFMIHMGDLTETGAASEYEELDALLSPMPFPLVATIGNHESRWQDPHGTRFSQYYGSANTSFNYGMWHFVVLDSTYPGETLGTLDPATIAWLEEDLAANPGRPIAVFSHHPLLYLETKFQDSDAAFAAIVDKYPIRVVFSGHGHSFIKWQAQGQRFQMVGALMDGSYAHVTVDGLLMTVSAVTQNSEGVYTEAAEWRYEIPGANAALPGNPVTSLTANVEQDVLYAEMNLSRPVEVYAQIDNGSFVSQGRMDAGPNTLTVDVSGHCKGIHSLTVKTMADGPYFTSVEFDKASKDVALWRLDLGSAVVGEMLPKDTAEAIVGTRDGLVRSVILSTGEIKWTFDALSQWGGGTLDGNRLYFGTASGDVYCLNAADGTLIWKTGPVDPIGFVASPKIASTSKGKFLIMASTSGNVYGINSVFGGKVWRYSAEGAVVSSPVVAGDAVFFGSWDTNFYALSATSGELLWSKSLARSVYYSPYLSPAESENTVYVGTVYDSTAGGSFLYAFDALTGQEKWKVTGTSSFMSPKAAPGYPVTVMDASGTAWAFSQGDGSVLGSKEGTSTLFGDPVGSGSRFVTGGYRGVIGMISDAGTVDFKVRDSHLFVTPLLISPLASAGNASVLVADTRGSLFLLTFVE